MSQTSKPCPDQDKQKKINKKTISQWIEERLPVFSMIQREYIRFPMPRNLNIWWTFGAVLTVVLVLMLATGIFLAMSYTPSAEGAFASIEMIERRVPSGWLLRSLHMAGSNLFLAFLYLHIFRGLYYGSYKNPRELVWFSGLFLMLMVMMTAFAGYILPWGQMSYWAANVVIQAISSIPWIGEGLAHWLMGGSSPNDLTLHRYFVLHFVMAFLIIGVVFIHVVCLHFVKSNNPKGIEPKTKEETLPFYPYYVAKDAVVIVVSLLLLILLAFLFPDLLTNSENYTPANPLETPANIAPEWYFLPFYGILQLIPFKFLGLVLSAGSLLILFAVPWLDRSSIKSATYRPLYRLSLFILLIAFVILGIVGKYHTHGGLIWLGRLALLYYYLHFLMILPFSHRFELKRILPVSLLDDDKGIKS
ncbi:cytochrome b N-terminal domain-containing protein [Commensalibacter papalotli (ex Botero et al. 2024)]|uniref:cytochrome b n=1 Tax=Commensalibacter papalotli (ex Botero et al. 2024) TaxID=2972766 RepID=UPI0022FF68A4|nr:cytochrome b N-terminal domain-containing protein [Commensalibacter papalotli (ex Botero et al. 2024)]CAI3923793.1 Cytochrome b subunit of the bc complex (QcrB/PetB) (PDB:1VF5) [Commensalibacter papalotli (ex Botero et al. 2024)]